MFNERKEGERIYPDEELISSILMGNQQAFRVIINRYSNLLYKIVFGIVRNQKDAEDLTQEAFIQIYQSLSSYQNQGFKTWMVRIATNKAIDFKRRQQRAYEELTDEIEKPIKASIDLQPTQPSPDQELIKLEEKELVHEKLNKAPENYRDVIFAYYIQEKSYKEIAIEQGIEVKTVEMKLYRAKKWMQKHWREEEFR